MTDALERGEEVRYNGIIMQMLVRNPDGTYKLRGLNGNPLVSNAQAGDIERKVNGMFSPLNPRSVEPSVDSKPEPPPKPEKRVLTVPPSSAGDARELKADEREDLIRLEAVVEKGITTYIEVGLALSEIRDRRLYRAEFKTWDEYVQSKWGMRRDYAQKLITASGVVGNLNTIVYTPPQNEAQARPLAQLPADQQAEAWKDIIETAPEGRVTAKHIRKVVDEKLGKTPKKPLESSPKPEETPDSSSESPVSTNTETAAYVVGVDAAAEGVTVIRRIDEDTGEIIDAKPDADALRRECRAIVDGLSADKIVILYPILVGMKQKGG